MINNTNESVRACGRFNTFNLQRKKGTRLVGDTSSTRISDQLQDKYHQPYQRLVNESSPTNMALVLKPKLQMSGQCLCFVF